MAEPTKGKWEISHPGENVVGVFTKEYGNIAMFTAQSKLDEDVILANARHICKCVNGWDDLVAQRDELLEALKKISKEAYAAHCNNKVNEHAALYRISNDAQ